MRKFLIFLALLAVLGIAGAGYQAVSSRMDAQRYPHPGQLVNAGIRLNLYCIGKGSPTVLLESGLADSLDSWRKVQPSIAQFTRVCSYDRAGYGNSDAGPMPRTADHIAMELHAALAASERPPYLLVGHSFGGYIVRVFHGKYPDLVTGLVLVDATQEDQYRLLPQAWVNLGYAMRQRAARQAFWAPLYIGLGIARLQLRIAGHTVPPLLLQAKYLKARASELENIETSAEQARAAGPIPDKPLVVLTAGKPIDGALQSVLSAEEQRAYQTTWINDLQPRLALLSAKGKRIIVPDSGHDIPDERPDVIVDAVRELCRPRKLP